MDRAFPLHRRCHLAARENRAVGSGHWAYPSEEQAWPSPQGPDREA